MVKIMESAKFNGFNKNAILLMRKQGIPVYDHYKMFKNRNYNNEPQKRLAKFALIKYRINFRNHGICVLSGLYWFSVESYYNICCYSLFTLSWPYYSR